jgi:hypothetical protein
MTPGTGGTGSGGTGSGATGSGGTGSGGKGRPSAAAAKKSAPGSAKPGPPKGSGTRPSAKGAPAPKPGPAPAAKGGATASTAKGASRTPAAKAAPAPKAAAAKVSAARADTPKVTASTSSPPPPRSRRVPALVMGGGALAVGLVLGVLLYVGWAAVADDDPTPTAAQVGGTVGQDDDPTTDPTGEDPTTDPTTDPTSTDGTTSAPAQPVDDRIVRCADAARALSAPLDAAEPALDQWAVHVGAMNQLVTGAITLQQANDFWNRTRVGADRTVEEFRAADKTMTRTGVDCPAPALLGAAGPDLRGCSRTVAAELRALRLAGTAVDTWAVHVRHMEMLRKGTLSPEDATAMWLSMWQEGVRQLDGYRRAQREVRTLPGCPA